MPTEIRALLATLNRLDPSQQQQLLRYTETLQAEQTSAVALVAVPIPRPLLASPS